MICPRCGDVFWTDKNESYCSTCGYHDWDSLDLKREVFFGVHYQGQATRRDGASEKVWELDTPYHSKGPGKRPQTHISMQIRYLEAQRGRNGTLVTSAHCMLVEGFPEHIWSRYNLKVHQKIRRLFKQDTGLTLRDLEAALDTGLRPSTRTS